MKRVGSVIILKEIPIPGLDVSMPRSSRIELDKSYPVNQREHQVIYKQGFIYGIVGDRCCSITNDYLLELDKKGIIHILPSK